MRRKDVDQVLAREAKAIVVLAFRNGPIENLHAGKRCPACSGKPGFSRITDLEMKQIMKNAVDYVYKFSVMKRTDREKYERLIAYGNEIARLWDDPLSFDRAASDRTRS